MLSSSIYDKPYRKQKHSDRYLTDTEFYEDREGGDVPVNDANILKTFGKDSS